MNLDDGNCKDKLNKLVDLQYDTAATAITNLSQSNTNSDNEKDM